MEHSSTKATVSGYPLILGYLGFITMLIGAITLLPLLTLIAYPEEIANAKYFIIPGGGAICLGYLFSLLLKDKENGRLEKHHDAIIVVSVWIIAIICTAIPFIMTGKYNFTQAVFETSSGWSTTGLSVVDVAHTPHIFLMHRSLIMFFGGVGLVLVMLSALSDSLGMKLYNAEGHSDKLLPNLLQSSRIIMAIYAGIILSGTIMYTVFGMPVFDSLNHAITAVATGGFSTKADSIGYYNSIPIEVVSIVLMILGSISFVAHLYFLKGKFRTVFQSCEIRLTALLCAVFIPILMILGLNGIADNLPHSFRIATFQFVSALTTTGFQTVKSFAVWPSSMLFIMTIAMLIGGGAGSTAGGLKQYRVYILLKNIYWQIAAKFAHKRVVKSHIMRLPSNDKVIDDKELNQVNSFVFLYMMIFFAASFMLTCYGHPLAESMFEVSSAIGNAGISAGIMVYDAPSAILWLGSILMFVGRLEIYIIILAALKLTSDLKNKGMSLLHH